MTYMVRFAPTDMPLRTPKLFLRYGFDPSQGPGYVWHCHIVEHEDNDMMRPMNILPNPSRKYIKSGEEPLAENTILNPRILKGYSLEQNYPNPFINETEIRFRIPEAGHVQLKLFNYLGAEIKTLLDIDAPAGNQTVKLYTENLASGIYFYQLRAGEYSSTKKLVINR